MSKRQSIEPTYDSCETGPRYHVSTFVDGRRVRFMHPIDDPFARTQVRVGWRDALRALLRRGEVVVEVTIGAAPDMVEDVMELDGNYLGPNCTRRDEFNVTLGASLHAFAANEPPRSETGT